MRSRDKVYNFIVKYVGEHLYSPSVRDICNGTGLSSTSTVYSHLLALESDGLIKFEGVRRITLKGYKLEQNR